MHVKAVRETMPAARASKALRDDACTPSVCVRERKCVRCDDSRPCQVEVGSAAPSCLATGSLVSGPLPQGSSPIFPPRPRARAHPPPKLAPSHHPSRLTLPRLALGHTGYRGGVVPTSWFHLVSVWIQESNSPARRCKPNDLLLLLLLHAQPPSHGYHVLARVVCVA